MHHSSPIWAWLQSAFWTMQSLCLLLYLLYPTFAPYLCIFCILVLDVSVACNTVRYWCLLRWHWSECLTLCQRRSVPRPLAVRCPGHARDTLGTPGGTGCVAVCVAHEVHRVTIQWRYVDNVRWTLMDSLTVILSFARLYYRTMRESSAEHCKLPFTLHIRSNLFNLYKYCINVNHTATSCRLPVQCQSSVADIVWPLQGPMELLGPDLWKCARFDLEFDRWEVEMISWAWSQHLPQGALWWIHRGQEAKAYVSRWPLCFALAESYLEKLAFHLKSIWKLRVANVR